MNQIQEDQEEEEENQFGLAKTITNSIESLIYNSDSIKLFPAKWRSIKTQLDQLNSTLTLLSQEENNNRELTHLLNSILSTCKETHLLADQCRDDTYTRGHLFLRSELNVMINKIDCYVIKLERIYACSLIGAKSRAIVVSKPGFGATKDEIRFFLMDLFARLKVGDLEMRLRAMCTLNEALNEDERYVKLIEEEGLSQLINLIEFGEFGVQEQALETILVIARHETYKNTLVINGIISPIVKIISIGSELSKEHSLRILNYLTENGNNAWSVSSHGGVNILLKVCNINTNRELICLACQILKKLSGIEEIKEFMLEQCTIEILSRLVSKSDGHDEEMDIRVIELLTVLSSGERVMVIGSLLRVLDPVMTRYSSKTREVALKSIEEICFSSLFLTNKLIDLGFIDRVLFFLRHSEVKMQEIMLKTTCNLCRISERAKIFLGQNGFMLDLIRITETKSCDQAADVAAETLFLIISIQRNQKRFIQGEFNVARILKLVSCEEEKLRKYLLFILVQLSECSLGRRKIGGSDYFKNVEMLAQNNVIEAKKILKRVRGGNKIKDILNGFGIRSSNK